MRFRVEKLKYNRYCKYNEVTACGEIALYLFCIITSNVIFLGVFFFYYFALFKKEIRIFVSK